MIQDKNDAVSVMMKMMDTITDVDTLRSLREYADNRVQSEKNAKAMQNKAELENKYKGRYLVIYGHYITMTHSTVNKNDIKVVYVKDIEFKGHGFFRCKAKAVHIKYNDELKQPYHLTADEWGSVSISYTEDDQYDINESDIAKVTGRAEAYEIIGNCRKDINNVLDYMDI